MIPFRRSWRCPLSSAQRPGRRRRRFCKRRLFSELVGTYLTPIAIVVPEYTIGRENARGPLGDLRSCLDFQLVYNENAMFLEANRVRGNLIAANAIKLIAQPRAPVNFRGIVMENRTRFPSPGIFYYSGAKEPGGRKRNLREGICAHAKVFRIPFRM